ncbi:MAG: cytochrome d ubiquinol oxidase subunit II, partial [Planctomycetota bacterium]
GPVWEANHVWFVFVLVLLFSAFPGAFAAIATGLFGALTCYAIGIVLRGAAFTFRHYDLDRARARRWGGLFSAASVACPFLLGLMGALLLRDRPLEDAQLAAFPIASGLFVVALCALLAAVFLAYAASEAALADAFRARASAALVAAGVLSVVSLALARSEAPRLVLSWQRPWLASAIAAAPLCGFAALAALRARRYGLARMLACALATAVVVAWGLALDDRIAPPDYVLERARAPEPVLRFLVGASIVGFAVLVPSLALLFRVFRVFRRR